MITLRPMNLNWSKVRVSEELTELARLGCIRYDYAPAGYNDICFRPLSFIITVINQSQGYNSPWLLCPKPSQQAALRLFCFPYSGASASVYYDWASVLPISVELFSIQLPGRANRLAEPGLTDIEPVVEAVGVALTPLLDKPFAFFGHSLGATIAFEVARSLRRQDLPEPDALVVSGHGAPQIPDDSPQMHNLPDPELVESLRRLNGMAAEVLDSAELMKLILPILRADLTMSETYAYHAEEPLSCQIFTYGGLQDRYVSRDDLNAWQEQTRSDFRLRMFPGDHFYLNASKQLLLQALARDLDRIIRGQSTSIHR